MVRITQFLSAAILLACSHAHAANNAVSAEPDAVAPGEAVTLHWYFTGERVSVMGGRFGGGATVTGRTSLVDHPHKTTRYTFDVRYKGLSAGARRITTLHARYQIVVQVDPSLSTLVPYSDPHGWQVRIPRGWSHNNVPQPDEGSDGLVYFQREEDSVERLAVAIMPATYNSPVELMGRVRGDIASYYDEVAVDGPSDARFGNASASRMTFTGLDRSHPGVRTRTIVIAFLHKDRAYIISARTDAAHFGSRKALLERMVRSFRFSGTAPLLRTARLYPDNDISPDSLSSQERESGAGPLSCGSAPRKGQRTYPQNGAGCCVG